MANLKAASPLCRRIVPSFLDFLKSVEPTSSVPKSVSLVRFFSSQPGPDNGIKSDQTRDSKTSETLNDAGKEKGAEDPEDYRSSKKKNHDSYPKFNLDDYPDARDEDRQLMKLVNEYNRRNLDIIGLLTAKKKPIEEGRVNDDQIENLGELLKSVCEMYTGIKVKGTQDDNKNKNNNNNNSSHGNKAP